MRGFLRSAAEPDIEVEVFFGKGRHPDTGDEVEFARFIKPLELTQPGNYTLALQDGRSFLINLSPHDPIANMVFAHNATHPQMDPELTQQGILLLAQAGLLTSYDKVLVRGPRWAERIELLEQMGCFS